MREKLLMNRGWLYHFGEPEYLKPKPTSSDQTYRGSRSENARGPARRDFDDSAWKQVTLPHDFVNENGPDYKNCKPGEKHRYPLDRGTAWYRRYFKLDKEDEGKRITLLFDGAALNCKVYVNSMLLKTNHTAGIGFEVDITQVAKFGTDYNVVSVHCDCTDFEAWYYEGGGIYRDVYLIKTDPLSVDLWGTFVKSTRLEGNTWNLDILTEVRNDYYDDKTASVVSSIIDKDGNAVASINSESISFPQQETMEVWQSVELESPLLWSPKQTNMYMLKTQIVADGKVVDEYDTPFGIREITFDKDKGMFLNGEKTVIYGFANHQIQVGMGNAMSDSMREYQMRTIRDIGGNGFRTAHSPHGPATYDYCDKYGLMVMDENRIFQPGEIRQDEVKRLIKRDRNHPSVVMWSLYNEEDTVSHETGRRIFKKLYSVAKKYDDSRPISGATSYGMFTEGSVDDYDIFGVNHQTMNFPGLHAQKPDKPLYCSEMVFPLGPVRPGRDAVPGQDARALELPYAIGGFHFTAWTFGSGKGRIFDCDGRMRSVAHGFKAYLKQDEPYMKICPGWDMDGFEGKEVELLLANNGDYVEIEINGKPAGRFTTDMYSITPACVVYEPGTIKATAYKNGEVWATDTACTPGAPVSIKMVMENEVLYADDNDVAIISAYLIDKDGNICTNYTGMPTLFVSNEAGEYVSSVRTRDDGFMGWHDNHVTFFEGKTQLFFRSLDTEDDLVITAIPDAQLDAVSLTIVRDRSVKVPSVPVVPNNFVLNWRISPLMPYTIDMEGIMRAGAPKVWEVIDTLGSPDVLFGANERFSPDVPLNYAYYNKAVVPDMGKAPEGEKLYLAFEGFDGVADIYLVSRTETMHASHAPDSPWPGHYRPVWYVDASCFDPGEEVTVWIFVHAAKRVTGIGWPVHWHFLSPDFVNEYNAREKREWAQHLVK